MSEIRIAVVSTSLAAESRSRIAARYGASQLEALGAEVDWIDLHQSPVRPYPLDADSESLADAVARVQSADGLLLAFPIHNWGESGHARDFLAYALDKERMLNRVCLLVAGCGTTTSFLAPMSMSRTLQGEINAVVIGPGIMACGDDVDRKDALLSEALKERLDDGTRLLAKFASVPASAPEGAGSE